jgi:hypothetical protein
MPGRFKPNDIVGAAGRWIVSSPAPRTIARVQIALSEPEAFSDKEFASKF